MKRKVNNSHLTWCNYMIHKTNKIIAVKEADTILKGIKTNGMTRNELIEALSE